MTVDPDRVHERLCRAGTAWAERTAVAELLEERKKTLLAELTLQHLAGNSKAAAEARALASPDYATHLGRMVRARQAANRARVAYDAARLWCELARTREVSRRAALQAL